MTKYKEAEEAFDKYIASLPKYIAQFYDGTLEPNVIGKQFFIAGYMAANSERNDYFGGRYDEK